MKLRTQRYDEALRKLQAELCRLQEWVLHKSLRLPIVFEGRDAAGRSGTIRALTGRIRPRVSHVVALFLSPPVMHTANHLHSQVNRE